MLGVYGQTLVEQRWSLAVEPPPNHVGNLMTQAAGVRRIPLGVHEVEQGVGILRCPKCPRAIGMHDEAGASALNGYAFLFGPRGMDQKLRYLCV